MQFSAVFITIAFGFEFSVDATSRGILFAVAQGNVKGRNFAAPVLAPQIRHAIHATPVEIGEAGKDGNTKVVLRARSPPIARTQRMPLTADDPDYGEPPPQDERRYADRLSALGA